MRAKHKREILEIHAPIFIEEETLLIPMQKLRGWAVYFLPLNWLPPKRLNPLSRLFSSENV